MRVSLLLPAVEQLRLALLLVRGERGHVLLSLKGDGFILQKLQRASIDARFLVALITNTAETPFRNSWVCRSSSSGCISHSIPRRPDASQTPRDPQSPTESSRRF